MVATAFVFAAGYGKRMLPLTETTPKPMAVVSGKMLIEHILDCLSQTSVRRVVINMHHLADKMERCIATLQKKYETLTLIPIYEPTILETGGGITNALNILGSKPFFTINGDVYWDHDPALFTHMAGYFDSQRMDALLLLQSKETAFGYSGAGDFTMNDQGQLSKLSEQMGSPYVYTGIQILSPSLFSQKEVRPFPLRDIYNDLLSVAEKERRIYGMEHRQKWYHIGTVDDLKKVNALLEKAKPIISNQQKKEI